MNKSHLIKKHEMLFKDRPHAFYFAPGRVNLIGEHIDYCGGYVMPMALSIGTYASVSKRSDALIKIYSENDPKQGISSIETRNLNNNLEGNFSDYIKGTMYMFQQRDYPISQGLNIYIEGDMPTSAGLSSSASLELLMGKILQVENRLSMTNLDLAHIARAVENDYLGLSSGMMDQFAIAFGKKGHALYLNTKTLSYTHVPIDLNAHVFVLMNTNKKRNLITSNYNDRVHAIHLATNQLSQLLKMDMLCDITPDQFNKHQHILTDENIKKRAMHAVYENHRTIKAYEALNKKDMTAFGKLMHNSHQSLKELYEVSCDELDYLVDWHMNQGALGARMTGAGFGGTMVALYHQNQLPETFKDLKNSYKQRFDKPLDIIISSAEEGVKELKGDF